MARVLAGGLGALPEALGLIAQTIAAVQARPRAPRLVTQ